MKLYVGNISYDTTRDDLVSFFEKYGVVQDVYIPLDKVSELPRGFAFVTMETDGAVKAIESADGIELQGRTIEVKESLPRGQKAPSRGKKISSEYLKSTY